MAIVIVSAVGAVLSDASPTANTIGDLIWNAAAGATVARATVDARRWTWFPMAGAAAALGQTWLGLALGVGSLGAVFAAGFFAHRRRWIGALVGALAVNALLRGYTYGPTGIPTLVATAACAPMLVSAVRNASATTRRRGRNIALVAGLVIGILTVFTAVSALQARDRVSQAIDFADAALAAAESGDEVLAAARINAAAEELDEIATDFDRPWLYPARFVPVLGQHSAVLGDVARAGASVADVSTDVLVAIDPDELVVDGTIDTIAVTELAPPLTELRNRLSDALDDVAGVESHWLVAPAADRVDEIKAELEDVFGTVEVAESLVAVTPELLGVTRAQRYLVLFTTPSESRGLGGFIGNWATIAVDNGRIRLEASGRSDDVNAAVGPTGVLIPQSIAELYAGFELERTFANLSVVPDFPTVANLARIHYETGFDVELDGVIQVDHAGMAGIAALTGPLDIDGTRMNATELEEFILRGQYERYADDNEARLDALAELTDEAFENLVALELPSPQRIVDVFGPLVEGDHVRVITFDARTRDALAETDLTDGFPVNVGQDLLAVIGQNLGENKIDIFLERTITYEADVDPTTGRVQSTLTVELVNNAPASGLPPAILLNNDQGLAEGTNRMRLQIYSPLELVGATLDGGEVRLVPERELGWNRYRRDIRLDAGQAATLVVQFDGLIDLTDGYLIGLEHQPLVAKDNVMLRMTSNGSEEIRISSGIGVDGRISLTLDTDITVGFIPAS